MQDTLIPTYVITDSEGSGGELKLIPDANGGIPRSRYTVHGQNYSQMQV